MPSLPYFQLDVFTEHTGGGNPLAVVVGGEDWSDRAMQRFAAWTNVVETTFVLPPGDSRADYRLRIFTPTREIPFAGHPSIGSAHAALEAGVVDDGKAILTQECGAGLLPVAIEHHGGQRQLFVQAPPAAIMASGRGIEPRLDAILGAMSIGKLPPALVQGGRSWWLAELSDETGLRAWSPDHAAIAELARATDSLGLCVFARSTSGDCDLTVRAFPCGIGIDEDPASGAANSLIAGYLAQAEPRESLGRSYLVSQGREIGRDARLHLRIEANGTIRVGGSVQTVIRGELDWP